MQPVGRRGSSQRNVASAKLLPLPALLVLATALALSLSPTAASPGWEIVLDRPTPSFGGIDFPSSEEGWLVAGAGLLRSTDGGGTWSEAAPLSGIDVDFADPNHGWLVGYDGSIYATSDGGERWHVQESGTRVHLGDVLAVSAQEAWAVGAGEGFSDVIVLPQPAALRHTTDGGATWQQVELPPNTWFREITFVAQHGWLLGDRCEKPPDVPYCQYSSAPATLLRSTDGGATWSPVDLSPDVHLQHDLVFVDEQQGWAIGSVDATEGPFPAVFKTTDGGVTWEELPLIAQHFEDYLDLAFQNASTGWLLVQRFTPPGNGELEIRKTTDGGATWSTRALGPSAGYGHRLHVANGALYITSQGSGAFLRSTDGGVSWQPAGHPAIVLNDIDFVDRSTGYALSGADLLRSDDAGRSWQRLGAAPEGTERVRFIARERGVAAGIDCCHDPALLQVSLTTDGGRSWRPVFSTSGTFGVFGIESAFVEGIDFVDALRGLIVLDGGLLFTDDGGATWRERRIDELGRAVFSADLADESNVWAVIAPRDFGVNDFLLAHSADTGRTWQTTAPGQPLTGNEQIEFADRDHGWYTALVCEQNRCRTLLFITDNGGETWQEADLGTNVQLHDIVFADQLDGWHNIETCEGGCRGEVRHTADGGRTWRTQLAGELLFGTFDFVDAETGWFALDPNRGIGIGGGPPRRTVLYHTTDAGGGPIGMTPTPTVELPDVGGGAARTQDGPSPALPLGALGAALIAGALYALVRRRRAREG